MRHSTAPIDAVMRWPPEASVLAAALRSLGDVIVSVEGRRLARRAPAVAPEFGVEDLVEWLDYKGLQDEPEHDAVFAALLTAEPHLWPRIRRLEIIDVGPGCPEALDNGLLVLGGDVAGHHIHARATANGKRVQANLGAKNHATMRAINVSGSGVTILR